MITIILIVSDTEIIIIIIWDLHILSYFVL